MLHCKALVDGKYLIERINVIQLTVQIRINAHIIYTRER